MKYPKDFYNKVDRILEERRSSSRFRLEENRKTIKEQYPEIEALRMDNIVHGAALGKKLLTSNLGDTSSLFEQQIERQAKLEKALIDVGLSERFLSEQSFCPFCKDKGFLDGRSCKCRIELLNQMTYAMLSDVSKIKENTFDNFSLDYYDANNQKAMGKLLESCKRYSSRFPVDVKNLLFLGATGLGKTHLSLAIAGEVAERSHLVIYASAPQLFSKLVDDAFSNKNAEGANEYHNLVYGCDLLVIDDLGTEFKTHVSKSEVYNLINTRINEGKITIISTNLTLKELEAAYEPRIVSRLIGEFVITQFDGTDIRYQKRMETNRR